MSELQLVKHFNHQSLSSELIDILQRQDFECNAMQTSHSEKAYKYEHVKI